MSTSSLDIFDKLTASWFMNKLGKPTAVQEAAWPAIASGGDTLVSAPTGTGRRCLPFWCLLTGFWQSHAPVR